MCYAGEIVDETPIDIYQSKERPQLFFVCRGLCLKERLDVLLVDFKLYRLAHVTEVLNFPLEKVALVDFQSDPGVHQGLEDLIHMLYVLLYGA